MNLPLGKVSMSLCLWLAPDPLCGPGSTGLPISPGRTGDGSEKLLKLTSVWLKPCARVRDPVLCTTRMPIKTGFCLCALRKNFRWIGVIHKISVLSLAR